MLGQSVEMYMIFSFSYPYLIIIILFLFLSFSLFLEPKKEKKIQYFRAKQKITKYNNKKNDTQEKGKNWCRTKIYESGKKIDKSWNESNNNNNNYKITINNIFLYTTNKQTNTKHRHKYTQKKTQTADISKPKQNQHYL